MTQFKDSLGQPIHLRDVVVCSSTDNRYPFLVTKFTAKQVRLSGGSSTPPALLTVVTNQLEGFDPTIRSNLLAKHGHEVVDAAPVVKTKVRYLVNHSFPYGQRTTGTVTIVRLEFADAAERDKQIPNPYENNPAGYDYARLILGDSKSPPVFTRWRYSVNDQLITERDLCSITTLAPGEYDWDTWSRHLMVQISYEK